MYILLRSIFMINNKKVNRAMLSLLIGIVGTFALTACNTAQTQKETSTQAKPHSTAHLIQQSKNDERQYKAVELPNKLELILVSDPSLERSAVALAVKAGSYDETNGFWGQAHFLEHMLFLGTKKYPEIGSYSAFISSNGGMNNAYTDMDHTNYMASIKNSAFEGLLDRFSDYFIAPLLTEKYIDKERNAVHSEWSMKGVYDGVILGHLNGLTLNPNHPVANFTWGNLDTLKDQNGQTLHQTTVDFYNKYYQANRMKVALVSNRSIAELEGIATKYFANVKNSNIDKSNITTPVITQAQKGKLVRYSPKKDLKKIQLKFVITNNSAQFLSKPNYYVSYLLNSEMPGTLTSVLKQQGLVKDFAAWADPSAFGNAGEFVIDLTLTKEGLKQRDIIIQTVFNYIALINKEGISQKYYQEIKQSLKNSFDYQSKYSEYSYASNLAAKMLEVPTKYLLSANYEFSHFSRDNIQQLLTQLTVDNARVFYIDQGQNTQQSMKYFKAKYQIDDISPEQKQRWENTQNTFKLNLPALNTMLPTNFDLVQKQIQATPVSVTTELGSILHVKHSDEFSVAKGGINLNFNTPLGTHSANEQAMLLLLHKAITEELSPLSTQAYSAGMSLSVNHQRGMTISTSGFTDKQIELQTRAINVLTELNINDKKFAQWKAALQTSLINQSKNALYTQAFAQYRTFLIEGNFPTQDLLKELSNLKLNDFNQFTKSFLQSARLNTFAFGNYEKSALISFIEKAEQLLDIQVASNNTPLYLTQYHQFDKNEQVNIKVNAPQNDVALIDAKWQKSTVEKEAIGKVLAKIVSPALFKQIRTEEQLGYSVGFYSSVSDAQISYAWYVQTPVKSPTEMLARFEAFQNKFTQVIASLNDESLNQYRQAVLVSLTQKSKNIYQEQEEYLKDWRVGKLSFNSKQNLIKAIEKVTVADIQKLYQQVIDPSKLARVIVQIKGENFAEHSFIETNNNEGK